MKNSFKYLAMAALAATALASCQFGEDEVSDPRDKAPAISINVDQTGDYDCTFTVAPSGKASFYSYSVVAGTDVDAPDAAKLYSVRAGGLAKGTVNYAENNSCSVTVSDLDCNSDYTIFAVAGSPTGNVGEVASISFHTSDTGLPVFEDVEYDEGVLTLYFSESVAHVKGMAVTVDTYAEYDYYSQSPYYPAPKVSTFELTEGEVGESSVSFELDEDELIGGSILAISFPEGAFVDVVGNKIDAMESVYYCNYYNFDIGAWEDEYYGCVIQIDNAPFKLGDALEIGPVNSIEDPVLVFPLGETGGIGYYYYYAYNSFYLLYDWDYPDYSAVGTIEFSQTSEDGRVSTYEAELPSDYEEESDGYYTVVWGGDDYYGAVYLNKEPLEGDLVTITIPSYAFYDVYYNPSAKKTYSFIYKPSAAGDEEVTEPGEGEGEGEVTEPGEGEGGASESAINVKSLIKVSQRIPVSRK